MSKEEKKVSGQTPDQEPGKEKDTAPATPQEQEAPAAGQTPQEPETFTVTREQMEKMEGLAQQLSALNDQHLRVVAEYDNYRKRTMKEKESIYQDAKLDTIAKFLEVYDNLERAVSQAGDDENVHKKGMEMIFHQLQGVLEKLGVTVVDPTGQPFDPERHNAVMHVEDENLGENIVSQVYQKGFLLGEKVIRFATVVVAN